MEQLDTNHERSTPPEPIFEFHQADGRIARLDMSTPGELGDFAFRDLSRRPPEDYYFAYHTATRAIFTSLLIHMVRTGRHDDITKITGELTRLTPGMTITRQGEGDFDEHDLLRISQAARQPNQDAHHVYPADGYGGNNFILDLSDEDATLSMERAWDNDELLTYSVTIPNEEIWKFLTGIMWRSFGEHNATYSSRSRVSTISYYEALIVCRGLSAVHE